MSELRPYGATDDHAATGLRRQSPRITWGRVTGRILTAVLPVALATTLLTACATPSLSGDLGDLQSLAAGCPDGPVVTNVRVDVSGSQEASVVESVALSVIRGQVEQAVACAADAGRGHLTVALFATNAAQTATVVDTDVVVEGATQIARLRRAVKDRVVEGWYARVVEAFPRARQDLPKDGSDVLSQFWVAGEAARQLEQSTGTGWALNLVVVTDGFATDPPELTGVASVAEGQAFGEQVRADRPLTGLGAWRVSMLGVGRTAGVQPSTGRIDGVKAFWRTVLDGTAEQVMVATDVAMPGSTTTTTVSPAAGEGR